jgi:hypothetical protein
VAPYVYYAIPIILYVRKDQVEQTIELLKDINLSITFGGQNKKEEDEAN